MMTTITTWTDPADYQRQVREAIAALYRQRVDAMTRPLTAGEQDALRILTDVRERYAPFRRVDDDIFRVLENRLIPLQPGEPVQFQKGFNQRWLNGTFGGPVDNPDDPQREGDYWVTATASGQRVPVFLSSVRRRGHL